MDTNSQKMDLDILARKNKYMINIRNMSFHQQWLNYIQFDPEILGFSDEIKGVIKKIIEKFVNDAYGYGYEKGYSTAKEDARDI